MNKLTLSPSQIILLLANIVPILGVLFWNWDLANILLLYWAETAMIAISALVKIFSYPSASYSFNKKPLKTKSKMGIFLLKILFCSFLLLHMGGFMAAHLGFLFAVLSSKEYLPTELSLEVILNAFQAQRIALYSLCFSHAFSLVYNYFIKGERYIIKDDNFMIAPYKRIMLFHITLIIGAWIIATTKSGALMLTFFIMLKILVDLRSHTKEHKHLHANKISL
jgi:hypothetical protein